MLTKNYITMVLPDDMLKTDHCRLYFVIAPARAGKSTLCDSWIREPHVDRPRVIVSGDDIHKAIHGDPFHSEAQGIVFATMDIMARACLSRGCDVIMDETATTEATIRRYLMVDIDAIPIVINTPLEVCIERAHQTKRPYLVEPIKRHYRQFVNLMKEWPHNLEMWRGDIREKMQLKNF